MKPVALVRKTICDKKAEVKLAFCYKFLPMDYMGYEFDSWTGKDSTCATKTFWISHTLDREEESFELEMYSCPNIKYRDLKTEQHVIIGDKYHVSEGKKHDSAILFLQKNKNDKNDKIYPEKYINNIVFEQLIIPEAKSRKKMRLQVFFDEEFIEYETARKLGERKLFFRLLSSPQLAIHHYLFCQYIFEKLSKMENLNSA